MVVAVLLIREFRIEGTERDGDGLPVHLLIPPLVVYTGWNLWFVRRSVGRLVGAEPDSRFLATVGALSLVRVWWLRLVADEVWWHHRHRLTPIIVASPSPRRSGSATNLGPTREMGGSGERPDWGILGRSDTTCSSES